MLVGRLWDGVAGVQRVGRASKPGLGGRVDEAQPVAAVGGLLALGAVCAGGRRVADGARETAGLSGGRRRVARRRVLCVAGQEVVLGVVSEIGQASQAARARERRSRRGLGPRRRRGHWLREHFRMRRRKMDEYRRVKKSAKGLKRSIIRRA